MPRTDSQRQRRLLPRLPLHSLQEAHLAYQRQRSRRIAYGRWNFQTDAETVRAHLRELSKAGIGRRRVAEVAGLSYSTLATLRRTGRVRHETATLVLAVTVENAAVADGMFVDATGTRRRIQALAAIGWSIAEQARRAGRGVRNHSHLLNGTYVTARLARLVAAQYEQLSGTPAPEGGSAIRARNWAAKQGWPPPLAWDDVDIDDPNAVPHVGDGADDIIDLVAIDEVLAGRLKFTDLREQEQLALFRDHLDGWGYNRIMDLLRMSAGTVQKWRTKVMYGEQVAA